jgi:hypothetical protein
VNFRGWIEHGFKKTKALNVIDVKMR